MTQQKIYTYIGVNGTITSPIFLEGIQSICKIQLSAGTGKVLTNGEKEVSSILVPESEVNNWTEINK